MKYRIRYIDLLIIFLVLTMGYVLFSGLTKETTNNKASLSTEKTVAAEEATIISVSVLDEVIGVGEQCTISIAVEPNKAIAGMQFDMNFDPSLVSADNIEEGDLLTQDGASIYFNSGVIDNESGTITGVYGAIVSPGESVSTGGTFAIITLTIGATKSICPLTLSNVIVGDLKGISVPVKLVNSKVAIS